MSTALVTTNDQALEDRRAQMQVEVVSPVVARAQNVEVTDSASAQVATELLSQIAKATKEIETERKDLKAPVLETGKRIDEFFKRLAAPLVEARSVIEPKVLAFRKAEADRIAAENAERERREREQREAAERAQREAEEQARREREEAARQAAKAEAEARRTKDEAAAQIAREAREREEAARLRERVAAETQVVEQTIVREEQETSIKSEAGMAIARKVLQFEVEDELRVPRRFLKVDESAIRQAVKEGERDIPGVRVWEEEKLAVRA